LRGLLPIGTLIGVKHWPYILIVLIVLVGAGYLVYSDRQRLGFGHMPGARPSSATSSSEGSDSDTTSADSTPGLDALKTSSSKPSRLKWRAIPRPADGFTVDLPNGTQNSEAPAYNESGGSEPVKILESHSSDDTVYAVTWQDNPPVARINENAPDRTLDQARDGMLARTQTTLVSETRILSEGSPGREILARNTSGGILNARLIYVQDGNTKDRLYTLLALFPTSGARNQEDVSHFFDSFVMSVPRS
jgi:hypothetical protein